MKKSWSLFSVFSVVFIIAVTVGGVFAARLNVVLSAVFILSGAIVWAVFFAHFRSIGYAVENGVLIIRSGFFIRAERRVTTREILWRTTVKLGSVTLFSVIHTSAGRAVIFASADLIIYSPRS